MRWFAKVAEREFVPIRVIEWVVVMFTLFGGFYLFSTLVDIDTTQLVSPLAISLANTYVVAFWGCVLFAGAIIVLIGLWKNKPQIKSVGWFTIVLARLFQILTIILAVGFFPLYTWFYAATITVVAIVLWAAARKEIRNAP